MRQRLLLGLLLAGFALLSWRWYHANGYLARPPAGEAGVFRVTAAELLVALEDGGPVGFARVAYGGEGSHTPGMPMTAALLGLVTGEAISPRVVWMTMTLYGVLLGLGTYRLARGFVGPLAACAVAGLTLITPVVSSYSRDFFTSLPMVALLVWSLDALVRSRCLASARGALLFGVCAALATWMKVIAPLYLAGPVAVAAACGARRHGWRAIARNAALAAAPFALLLGPWIARHVGTVGGYAQLAVETDHTRDATQGGGLLSLERWAYYPLWAVNNGYGFALGALVVAAAAHALRRVRSHGVESWIVASCVPVSWAVVTVGQTSGAAQYAMLWVPLGLLLLVHQLGALPRASRRIGGALLAAAALWSLHLSQRSFYADADVVAWGNLHLVGRTNQYLAQWARRMELNAAPEAEPWPVEEFTDLLLAHAGETTPRLGMSHPFVALNLKYEAVLRRRRIEDAFVPWPSLFGGTLKPGELGAMRYLIMDAGVLDTRPVEATLRRAGYEVEVLGERRVTPRSHVLLIALKPT
jgi:hypothetical protein